MRVPTSARPELPFLRLLALLVLVAAVWPGHAAAQTGGSNLEPAGSGSPIRLRQPGVASTEIAGEARAVEREAPPQPPGEFESYVRSRAGQRPAGEPEARRFGADLMLSGRWDQANDHAPRVPDDYVVSTGDEILLLIWGTVDADLRLVVDRSGRISIPRVGSVMVAGTRVADLGNVISQRVGQVFKNFQLTASIGQLRQIRIYVTGFTPRPGAYTVSSLSTIVNAVFRAGGPSAAGSFRNIELRRGGKLVSTLDLYDLLVRGSNDGDRVLQADDVVHIGPVGLQVGMIGSVNKPAVFELKAGETIASVLAMAGGFTSVADRSRITIERLDQRNDVRVVLADLPASASLTPQDGDVLRAFSAVETALPIERQNKRIRIEGEVARPGDYILAPSSSVADALRAAGGLTPAAYLYSTEFSRESVRVLQQTNYDRALRDLETELARAANTQRTASAEEAAAQSSRTDATTRLIQRLREIRPTGRVVLQLEPGATELPDLALEDADRIFVPPKPTTVGIFGSVFNGGSYLHMPQRTVEDYIRLAGGPTRGADEKSIFVVRGNGTVISARANGAGWFSSGLGKVPALPGDTIFVPEELNKTTLVQDLKDWTQILYQFGIGLAGLKSATR